jgi:hypothetical protein
MEMVERVNAKFAWSAAWFNESLDRRHRMSSSLTLLHIAALVAVRLFLASSA